ncbi:MAG TPA: hypothetical protein VGD76_05870 [Ramlibacter sp.]
MKRLLAGGAVLLLAGCVLVPRTVHHYDAECRVTVRHMELQPVQIASIQHCANDGCLVLLAAAGATAAASAVISGSITIVGNVVYWLERQGSCRPAS